MPVNDLDVRRNRQQIPLRVHVTIIGYFTSSKYLYFEIENSRILQVIHIDTPHGKKIPPLPDTDSNYHRDIAGAERPWRTGLKPLDIVQPEGPSFTVGLLCRGGLANEV